VFDHARPVFCCTRGDQYIETAQCTAGAGVLPELRPAWVATALIRCAKYAPLLARVNCREPRQLHVHRLPAIRRALCALVAEVAPLTLFRGRAAILFATIRRRPTRRRPMRKKRRRLTPSLRKSMHCHAVWMDRSHRHPLSAWHLRRHPLSLWHLLCRWCHGWKGRDDLRNCRQQLYSFF
jgi:hypothetical protein